MCDYGTPRCLDFAPGVYQYTTRGAVQSWMHLHKVNRAIDKFKEEIRNPNKEVSQMAEQQNNDFLKVEEVRITWPSIYEKNTYEGVETKYEVTLMIPKLDESGNKNPQMTQIGEYIARLMEEKKENIPMDSWCVKDGDHTKYDVEDNHWLVKVGSRNLPAIINEDGSMSNKDEGHFYSGCYCTVLISFWLNVKRQKRIVGELHAIQKVRDGDRLGGGISKMSAVQMLLGEDGAKKAFEEKQAESVKKNPF